MPSAGALSTEERSFSSLRGLGGPPGIARLRETVYRLCEQPEKDEPAGARHGDTPSAARCVRWTPEAEHEGHWVKTGDHEAGRGGPPDELRVPR